MSDTASLRLPNCGLMTIFTYSAGYPVYRMNSTDRRSFLKAAGLTGTGLFLGFSATANGTTKLLNLGLADPKAVLSVELHPFIIINNAGGITLINHRPDMGQGSWQAVPTLIAEELEVDMDQITIQQSDGAEKYGSQFAVGSGTIRSEWTRLRQAGAAAREMLRQAAATRWNAPLAECYAQSATIKHRPSGRSLTYAELVEEASKLPVPKTPALKAKKDFTLLGTSVRRPDIPAKSSGKAIYTMDVKLPGMLYASIAHSPVIHGKIKSIDDTQALKVPGVTAVVKTERPIPHGNAEAVAVVATSYWAALKGRRALIVDWETADYETTMTTARFVADLRAAAGKPSATYSKTGDVNAAYDAAPTKLEALYETPFLAHAPMEPEVAIAHVKADGTCELWASVQGPDMAKRQAAEYLKIPADKVTVHMPFLGGGFGRKGSFDFMLEAINISRQVHAPVKVTWTREDDITQGPFRSGMLSAMRGGIDAKGQLSAFEHTFIGESLVRQVFKAPLGNKPDGIAGEGISAKDSPYAFPNAHIGFINVKTDIPITFWRSVYASTSIFGHESFLDELAHATKKDPLTLRLELLKNQDDEVTVRFANVLNTLQQKADWNKPLPPGQGKGIAISRAFESICAHAVFVSVNNNVVKIDRIVTVLDCGMYVNPDNVRAQTEGNIVMGITAATKKGITFTKGRADQSNFDTYPVLRMGEMPPVTIHLIENEAAPGGVGEPGLPPLAPALCNAIFNATGHRIRTLPFDMDKVVAYRSTTK